MPEEEKMVKEKITEVVGKLDKEKFSKDVKEMVENALKNVFLEGMQPFEAMHLTEVDLENIYTYAFNLYQSGKFVEAENAFRLLVNLCPQVPRYLIAFAATFHKQKKFKEAASIYFAAAQIDPFSPAPYFHASDCFIQMDEKDSAIMALNGAINRMGDEPRYSRMKARAEAQREKLKQETKWDERIEALREEVEE